MTESGFLETTRSAYDARAAEYSEVFRDPLADKPLDRALIGTFAELVKTTGAGPIADLGCGPGHYTATSTRGEFPCSGSTCHRG